MEAVSAKQKLQVPKIDGCIFDVKIQVLFWMPVPRGPQLALMISNNLSMISIRLTLIIFILLLAIL
jgi:hypothetical protein